MDRIDSLGGFALPGNMSSGRKKTIGKHSSRISFSDTVDSALTADSARSAGAPAEGLEDLTLERLLDGIHALGEKLTETPTLSTIMDYKRAVRDFLRYVVENSLQVEEHESRTNVLNRKKFTLITVIDRKLESLAAGVLVNQKEPLELLHRVEELQGLLVDLLH